MTRTADPLGFSLDKKVLTMQFINSVERGKTKSELRGISFGLITYKGKSGKTRAESLASNASKSRLWCKYRKGGGAWPLETLQAMVGLAYDQKLISLKVKSALEQDIKDAVKRRENEKANRVEIYRQGLSARYYVDVIRSVDTLEKQIRQLAGRCDPGEKNVDKMYYYTRALKLLMGGAGVRSYITTNWSRGQVLHYDKQRINPRRSREEPGSGLTLRQTANQSV